MANQSGGLCEGNRVIVRSNAEIAADVNVDFDKFTALLRKRDERLGTQHGKIEPLAGMTLGDQLGVLLGS
jgi:hypothetical protein